MDSRADFIRKLKAFKSSIEKDFPVDKMILFGSRAHGKLHKNSDVDLIIVSQKFGRLTFFKRGAKMYNYWGLRLPVDFLCYSPAEFKKKIKQSSIIRQAV